MLDNGLLSLLCKLFPFQCIVASVKCLLFSVGKEALSMHAKQASPVCHCRTCDKYLPSSNKQKQRHQCEQPRWPCGFVHWVLFTNLARIQATWLFKCNVLKNPSSYYAWLFMCSSESWYEPLCAQCTLTVPTLCWIHTVPKRQAHNPIRDTWLVELIRAGDIVFHLWIKSHGPVS